MDAKIGFDPAENEPPKECSVVASSSLGVQDQPQSRPTAPSAPASYANISEQASPSGKIRQMFVGSRVAFDNNRSYVWTILNEYSKTNFDTRLIAKTTEQLTTVLPAKS